MMVRRYAKAVGKVDTRASGVSKIRIFNGDKSCRINPPGDRWNSSSSIKIKQI